MNDKNLPSKERAEELSLEYPSLYGMKVGKFDNTWAEFGPGLKDEEIKFNNNNLNHRFDGEYHLFDILPVENVNPEKLKWEVLYKYNKDWYRSDTFKKDHDGLHILFAGCSNTEGVGNNIDNVWPKIVYNEISKDYKTSGFFNLGRGGYGWHKIISAVLEYCNKYTSPDILVINHPNILRSYYWIEEEKRWMYTQQFPYATERKIQDKILLEAMKDDNPLKFLNISPYPTLYEERQAFPIWATAWNLFIEFCKAKNIKVVWTTWDDPTGNNIESSRIFEDTFFRIKEADQKFIDKHRPDGNFLDWDLKARDGHPGYLTNLCWAEEFLNVINDRGILDEVYKKSIEEA